MAKKESQENKPQDSSSVGTRRFDDKLERNFKDYHLKDNQWTYARNAINNSNIGDLGKLGNEPANLNCINIYHKEDTSLPLTIIKVLHVESDKYIVFSTDNTHSEIGYFEEDTCTYTTIVNDNCLNFNTKHLIYGAVRETSECNHIVYFADGNNPDRAINIGDIRRAPYVQPWPNIPYMCEDTDPGPCIDCEPLYPLVLDCDKIRLAPLMEPLCLRVEKGTTGGNLLNGSYFVVGAYTIKGQRMTDYFPPSNQQPLFDHGGVGGSINIYIDNADDAFFDEFELVIISVIAQQTVARRLGIYSTKQKLVTIDVIHNTLPAVPIEQIPIRSQIYDKSDDMYVVNDYLLRVGPTTKLDFNYQPLANQIVTKWQSVEYNADYYKKGGNKTGYMHDEVYPFFIRWVYDTGDRSASYHIPGRPSFLYQIQLTDGTFVYETDIAPINDDHIEILQNGIFCPAYVWEVYNTATVGPTLNVIVDPEDDCKLTGVGTLIQEGLMGYWESTELYPDNKPEIWNANIPVPPPGYAGTDPELYNLCGRPIRHHRFPDNDLSLKSAIFDSTAAADNRPQKIRIMGVKFENIKRPLIDPADPSKGYVPGITCFEILRGSRAGNRTVIAKGIINNMVEYDIPDDVSSKKGLFQNYPYNDLRGDEFLSTARTRWAGSGNLTNNACSIAYLQEDGQWDNTNEEPELEFNDSHYRQDYFSFHSPETTFSKPFLGTRELKVYNDLKGTAELRYQFPKHHPEHKLVKDLAWLLAAIAGLGVGTVAATGKINRNYTASLFDGSYPFNMTGLNIGAASFGFGSDYIFSLPPGQNLTTSVEEGGLSTVSPAISLVFQALSGVPTFSYYWAQGAETTFRLIKNSVAYQQYALQQFSHCFYDEGLSRAMGQRRRYIDDITYVDNQIQNFDTDKSINNLYRSEFVALKTSRALAHPVIAIDESRYKTSLKGLTSGTMSDYRKQSYYKRPERSFERTSSTYYAALKQRLRNQYGQLDSISQIPITTCPYCCLNGTVNGNLVINGDFSIYGGISNPLSDWSTDVQGSWYYGQDVTSNSYAIADLYEIDNSIYQTVGIAYSQGQEYNVCFEILSLQYGAYVEMSFSTTQATQTYTFTSPGAYCIQHTAGANDDNIVFKNKFSGTGYCPIDLVFAIDTSGSTSQGELNLVKAFVLNILNSLSTQITNGLIQIGFTTYNNTAQVITVPVDQYSMFDLTAFVNVLLLPTGDPLTNTGQGICLGNILLQTSGRPTAFKKLVLITDGIYNVPGLSFPCGFSLSNPFTGNPAFCPPDSGPNSGSILAFAGLLNLANLVKSEPNTTVAVVGIGSNITNATCMNNAEWAWIATSVADSFPTTYLTMSNEVAPLLQFITRDICEPVNTIIDNVSINQGGCPPEPFVSDTLFGGDIYVNRYTEKNTFFYFYDWLFKQPDGAYINYQKYNMLPYPTYWINTEEFDIMQSVTGLSQIFGLGLLNAVIVDVTTLPGQLLNAINTGNFSNLIDTSQTVQLFQNILTPSDYHVLDRPSFNWLLGNGLDPIGPDLGSCGPGLIIKYGYFYLFNSGVRDFYVESEYNIALRDWEDDPSKRHYDYKSYSSLPDLFNTEIIKSGNFYKYDTSLSIAKNWYSYVNWGNMQQRSYDPLLAETCYQYRPDRIIYSLPAQYESVRDNWRIFLANNYKDFLSRVTAVKQINKSGAIILFESDSPVMFQGLDTLQTDLGTKLTIGDGGLFSQPMQNLVNADRSYEYASCQDRLSVLSTPHGVFWINQNQGKIFQFSEGLKEISMGSVKWWLAQYLPYQLTKYFPNYQHVDNPVFGIGCQTIYDNQNNIIYFTKKDWQPKLDDRGDSVVFYNVEGDYFFSLQGSVQFNIELGDPRYFTSASWTLSYDLKNEGWIAYHDWHPDMVASSKNTFMTTKLNGIWIHNKRCDLYTNYYGVDYPFEVEYAVDTVQTVNTLRSIEYQLEVYRFKVNNCYDRHHVLDTNFDAAVIYNTEQCSGSLKLNLNPKNNPALMMTYPFFNPGAVLNEILYSKEENKYRFNQFWDTTRDRGEFPIGSAYPPTVPVIPNTTILQGSLSQQAIWSTGPDGYIKTLNTNNLDYTKDVFQRKKFRHYTTSVLLRKRVSGSNKFLVSLTNNKNLYSPR